MFYVAMAVFCFLGALTGVAAADYLVFGAATVRNPRR